MGDEKTLAALARLARSAFRRRFRLGERERAYLEKRGIDAMRADAEQFVRDRLAPAAPRHDGRQTPMKNHPVFVAQHATATCCRGCLEKWHALPRGRELAPGEQAWVVDLIMAWLKQRWTMSEEP